MDLRSKQLLQKQQAVAYCLFPEDRDGIRVSKRVPVFVNSFQFECRVDITRENVLLVFFQVGLPADEHVIRKHFSKLVFLKEILGEARILPSEFRTGNIDAGKKE